jgi:dTDP-4-dehydrorhamnose reductase
MRILITGVSGLLGINLALEFAREHEVIGVTNDHSLRGQPFRVIQADLTAPGMPEWVLSASHPAWLIHCAALANLDACESDPRLAQRMNAEVPGELAALARRSGMQMVHISTDAVFDGQRGDYTEEDAPNPLSVYARSKLEGEHRVLEAHPEAVVARVNLHGWSISGKRSLAEFFFYNLQAGKQVLGFTDIYFCPILVNDLAGILLAMFEKRLAGLYHTVSSESLTKYDFGLRIARRFGLSEALIKPASVNEGGLKAARSPRLTLKTDKLAKGLGKAMPAIAPGIERLYTLYQQGYPQQLRDLAA